MLLRCAIAAVTMAVLLVADATAQTYPYAPQKSKQYGILGGLAGAAIGAAIGEGEGDALPGALIGGAFGALSGAAVGDSIDQDDANRRAYANARRHQLAHAVTPADVVSMTRAGLGEDVVVTQIRTRGMSQTLTTHDLIELKQQGVSDRVINAMQYQPRATTVVRQPHPVVVERYHHYPAPIWHHGHHYHHHHRHHPRHGIHFSFGH